MSDDDFFSSSDDETSFKWHLGLTDDEIKKYSDEYNEIFQEIHSMPRIADVLRLNVDKAEKKDIIEKILILHRIPMNTLDFMQVRKHIVTQIENADEDLKSKVYQSGNSYIIKKYKQLSNVTENYKLRHWIDVAVSLPQLCKIEIIKDRAKYLKYVKSELDKEVYGLEAVKERILIVLAKRFNYSTGVAFGICGPPGTAKTTIILALSKILQIPFYQINLGGAKDSSFLLGHSYTYENSSPGAIVNALISMKYKNGIIYFDEFDKMSTSEQGIDISHALLHIMDFTQNHKFHDKYLTSNVDIDLSKMIFICSMNDEKSLDKTLLDRISIIHVNEYSNNEKLQICKNYLLPKITKELGLFDLTYDEDALNHIVNEKSMRTIKHVLQNIVMKLNYQNMINSCNMHISLELIKSAQLEIVEKYLSFYS